MLKAKRTLAVGLSFLLIGGTVQRAAATVVRSVAPRVSAPTAAAPTASLATLPGGGSLSAPLSAPRLDAGLSLVLPGANFPTVLPASAVAAKAAALAAPAAAKTPLAAASRIAAADAPRGPSTPGAKAAPDYSALRGIKTVRKAVARWTGGGAAAALSKKASPGRIRSVSDSFWENAGSRGAAAVDAPARGDLGSLSRSAASLQKPGTAVSNAADAEEPRSPESKKAEKKKPFYRQLWFWIGASLVAGAGTGLLLNSGAAFLPAAAVKVSEAAVSGTAVWGDWFMNLLRWMAGPLVLASVTSAIGGHENPKDLGGLFPRVMAYFLFTTVVAVGIGLGLGLLIEPGSFFPPALLEQFAGEASTVVGAPSSIWDVFSGIVPRSFREAAMAFVNVNALQIVFMALVASGLTILARALKFKSGSKIGAGVKWGASKFVAAMTALQKLVMALLSGKRIALKSGRSFFIPGLMHTAPIAVFGLLGRLTADMGMAAFSGLGAYVGTVLLGLVGLIAFYSLLIKFVGKRSPMKFLGDSANAAVTGFSTASSAATIPVSLDTAIKKHKISKPVAKLMITMGSAINMEGTALYQVVALLFLAQVFGIALTPMTTAVIIGTLLLSSLGTPGSPGAGMAILTSIAISLGIPAWGTGLLLSVDRPLDMTRTAVNVLGDQTSALVIDRVDQKRKKKLAQKIAAELAWLKNVRGFNRFDIREFGEEGERVQGRHILILFDHARDLADFAESGKMIRSAGGLPVYYKPLDESGVVKMTATLSPQG
jgi:Na+/H+-dicarboxylate symporter